MTGRELDEAQFYVRQQKKHLVKLNLGNIKYDKLNESFGKKKGKMKGTQASLGQRKTYWRFSECLVHTK